MVGVYVYRSGSWHELVHRQQQWLGDGPWFMVIPEEEEKSSVARLFPGLEAGSIHTIPGLVERYIVDSLGHKGLVTLHGMESILSSIISEGFVPYLNIEKYRQGYIKALTNFIYNFRRTSNLDLKSALEQFRAGEERLSSKETDLVRLYAEYEKRLAGYGHDYKSGLEHFVRYAGGENISRHLGMEKGQRPIFFGFNCITPLESEFISFVFNNAAGSTFLACEDPGTAEQAVRVQKSVAALLERAGGMVKVHDVESSRPTSMGDGLSQVLFQPDLSGKEQDCGGWGPGGRVVISRENNRFSEVVSMARHIRHLHERGVSLERIRIAAPESHLYGTIIQEVFPEYGIPFVLEKGLPLLGYPLASVIHCLVNQGVSSNPFPMREKIFSSPYIRYEATVNVSDLLRYQETAGVKFMDDRKPVSDLLPENGARYVLDFGYTRNMTQSAFRVVKPASGTPLLEVIRQYLNGLNWKSEQQKQDQMLKCLIQFYLLDQAEKALSAWPSRGSAADFKEALLGLFRRFHLEENITFVEDNSLPNPLIKKIRDRDLEILRQVHLILDELSSCLAPMGRAPAVEAEDDPSPPTFSRQELARIFSRLMSEAHLPAGEGEKEEKVAVHTVHKGCYRQYDHTFICGLVDGEFPRGEDFNFLQPKKEGLSIGSPWTSVDYARNHFYHLVRSTAENLYLSLPVSHNGKKLPPSPFVAEMEKCLPPGENSVERESDRDERRDVQGDRLFSRREKLLFIGKNVDRNYEKALPLLQELREEDRGLYNHVAGILRYDGLNLNARSFSEFDGMFSGEGVSLALLKKALDHIAFTPTVMERYAACPLRFFLDDVMSMKKEPDFHPDTSENGVIVRSILQAYTARAAEEGDVPAGAEELLLELVRRYYNEEDRDIKDAFEARFLRQLLAGLEDKEAKRPGLFSAFLDCEKNSPDLLKPFLANLSGAVLLDDKLQIRVEVDRADRTPGGDKLVAYNYSTADTGDPFKIKKGLRFALPLAIMFLVDYAAEKGLEASVGGGGIYLVKSPKNIRRGGYFAVETIKASRRSSVMPEKPVFSGQRHGFVKDNQFPEKLDKIKEHLLKLHRLMQSGVFHLPLCSERDQSCGSCAFGRVCRKDQLRLDRLFINLVGQKNIHMVERII